MRRKTLLASLLVVGGLSCGQQETASPPPAEKSSSPVLATVNGLAIHESDVLARLKTDGHNPQDNPERRKAILEELIRQELAAQKAVDLGLDSDAQYQEKLRQLEAQLAAFRRGQLSQLYFQQELAKKGAVGDEAARKYYEANTARIRTDVHVLQILKKDPNAIEEVKKDLEAGKTFEEIATSLFGQLPEGAPKPWDLGFLHWSQIPPAWRDTLDGMKDGETSPVISGPNQRYWIIKLVERRENPELTFEATKPVLLEQLKGERQDAVRAQAEEELRSKAKIVYSNQQP